MVDNSTSLPLSSFPSATSTSVDVVPDGMLLYTAQASYEPGTSPLSSWIPIIGYTESGGYGRGVSSDRPLDMFERLVKQRMVQQQNGGGFNMDVEG